jgi:hypothetical protein
MSPYSLAVLLSLILLGIGVVLVIAAAVVGSKSRALVITAATWITVAFVATLISVILHHMATKYFVHGLSVNQINHWNRYLQGGRSGNYSPDFVRVEDSVNTLPNLTRDRQLPYYDTYVNPTFKRFATDFLTGKQTAFASTPSEVRSTFEAIEKRRGISDGMALKQVRQQQ